MRGKELFSLRLKKFVLTEHSRILFLRSMDAQLKGIKPDPIS